MKKFFIPLILTCCMLTACGLPNDVKSSVSANSDAQSVPQSAGFESSAASAVEPSDVPLELLEWIKTSGWDVPEEFINGHSTPVEDAIAGEYPKQLILPASGYVYERQQGNSCSGYAGAYLLRYLGEDISGQKVYDKLDFKIADGLVLPQGITNYFETAGYPVTLYQGELTHLKARLSVTGKPIIVLVGDGMNFQHYIALVGYDEKSLYFFDSNADETSGAHYNLILSNEEFAQIWQNTIPGFERIYLALN